MAEYALVAGDVDDNERYSEKLKAEAERREHGIYPRTVFVAVGGTGAKALLFLRRFVFERFGRVDALPGVAYLSIDSDINSVTPSPGESSRKDPFEEVLRFKPHERLNVNANFANVLGANLDLNPHIREWWDDSLHVPAGFNIEKGLGQLRPLSRLAFFLQHGQISRALGRAYSAVTNTDVTQSRVDVDAPVRFVVVAGLAGGTGSGMFLDLAALIRRTFPSPLTVEAILALPGVVRGAEDAYAKVAANGYAALLEANHYLAHPFDARWERDATPAPVPGLYNRAVVFSGTNYAGTTLKDDNDAYRAMAEGLFLEFAGGPMAGWIQSVRINRAQYLKSYIAYRYRVRRPGGGLQETHSERWLTEFSSFGISKLVFPSWRLLNYAKYDLAAEMVGLMDRGGRTAIADLITRHRDRFMFRAGIFQGDLDTEEGSRQRHWQLRDALARVSGAHQNAQSLYEHIQALQRDFVAIHESMYAEQSTTVEATARWRQAQNLLGDPYSEGSEGDWAIQIQKNRIAFERQVAEALPRVIEEFRALPAVGPSGVRLLIEDVLATLDRPAEQVFYAEWFKAQKPRVDAAAQEAQRRWERQVKNADQASRGLFKNADSHNEAIVEAGKSFEEYWRNRVNGYLADEAVRAVEGIKRLLSEQLRLLDRICDDIAGLHSHYVRCRDYYAAPNDTTLFRELKVNPADISKLLEPYLTANAEERRQRLERLLHRGLREMRLDTLEKIASRLSSDLEGFRENLAAQAFYALRGENGWTSAFTGEEQPPERGFIERNAILRRLPTSEAELQPLLEELYKKSLPWVAIQKDGDAMGLVKPKTDAFVGFVSEGETGRAAAAVEKVVEEISRARDGFTARRVRVSDPSEIIFFTELNAIPAFAIREVHHNDGLKHHYDTLLDDETRPTPLHLHRDYHEFQELVPLSVASGEVELLKGAWRLFVLAQMLGVIRAAPASGDDGRRFVYQHHQRLGVNVDRWPSLGPQGRVIRRLMRDSGLAAAIRRDVDEKIREFTSPERGGSYAHLASLAEYYCFCVFPARLDPRQEAAGQNAVLGSMQNLVCSEVWLDWLDRAANAAGVDRDTAAATLVSDSVARLREWTLPISHSAGQPVPASEEVVTSDHWKLMDLARGAVRQFVADGVMKESTDRQGNPVFRFPRLAVNWDKFQARRAAGGAAARMAYRGPDGNHPAKTAADVADLVARAPDQAHLVLPSGASAYVDARSVPEVVRELRARGVALAADGGGPVDAVAPPGGRFHHACDGAPQGERTAEEVAAAVRAAPGATHLVWAPGFAAWTPARDVPAIGALLAPTAAPPLPPPLPSAGPPPLPAPAADAGPLFHYTCGGVDRGRCRAADVAQSVAAAPGAKHRVWAPGWPAWQDAAAVPEIAALLAPAPPPDVDVPPPDVG